MSTAYSKLTEVKFLHNYFADNNCRSISAYPTLETEKLLKKTAIIFRVIHSGLELAISNIGGPEVTKFIIENSIFHFWVCIDDPHFLNYTELYDYKEAKNIFNFENNHNNYSESGINYLHPGKVVDINCLTGIENINLSTKKNIFALITLAFKGGLKNNFSVRFETKKTYWKYIFIGEHLSDLKNPCIINKDSSDQFSGPEPVTLANNKKAITFTSKAPIAFAEIYRNYFKLVERDDSGSKQQKILFDKLPHPDINTLSIISTSNEHKNISEIYIYL